MDLRRTPAVLRRAGAGLQRRLQQGLHSRRFRRAVEIAIVAGVGGLVGLLVGGAVRSDVGPVKTRLMLRPSLAGGTSVDVAPLGAIRVDTHNGPFRLVVSVTQLRPAAARRAFADPDSLRGLGDEVARDLRTSVVLLTLRSLAAAGAGAAVLGLLVFRRRVRRTGLAVVVAVAAVSSGGGIAALTWRPQALAEPQYTGLLTGAPALVGSARDIVERFSVYSTQLAGLVRDVSRLYDVAATLPSYQPDASTLRLLHISDLHLNPSAWEVVRSILRQYDVDAVIDTGDLTDHGSAAEHRYADAIGSLGVPYIYVRGNHDSLATEDAVRRQRGAVVLDGSVRTVSGVRVFGVGDPRFTPDKTTNDDNVDVESLRRYGRQAADRLAVAGPVDIALAHDPVVAGELTGSAPLVLAGHSHQRKEERRDDALMLIQGSTGGAGLRGLEGERPTPLECSVLYLDRTTRRLLGYDAITLGGIGLSSAQIQRHVAPTPADASTESAESVGAPAPVP